MYLPTGGQQARGWRNHDKHRGEGSASMTIRVERDGPVTTVILDRPDARNAVDGPTAAALAEAFRAFDADDGAHVAVLSGRGRDVLLRRRPQGDRRPGRQPGRTGRRRADGADPAAAVQAGDRRGRRACRGRRPGTGAVVRPAGGRGGRGVRRLLPPLGGAADRRRHGPAAADRRPGPGAGHDPDRAGGRRPGGAGDGAGRPGGPAGPGAAGGARPSPTRSPRCRSSACAATGRPRWRAAGSARTRRWPTSSATA